MNKLDIPIINKSSKCGNFCYNGSASELITEIDYSPISNICNFKEGLYQINIQSLSSYRGNWEYYFKGLYRRNGIQCVHFRIDDLSYCDLILERLKKESYREDIQFVSAKWGHPDINITVGRRKY